MSKEALTKLVQRSISDVVFRGQLAADPIVALRGYDLTADEIMALQARDAAKLTSYGVELRMSKAFSVLDPGSAGNASFTAGEPRDVAPVWIGDYPSSLSAAVQSPDAADRNAALLATEGTTAGAVQSPDAIERNLSVGQNDGNMAPTQTYDGNDDSGYLLNVGHDETPSGGDIHQE